MKSETQSVSIVPKTIKKLSPLSVIKKLPPINHQETVTPVRDQETVTPVPLRKSVFASLSGSRLWPYSGLNRPERCGSSSFPCTVSSLSFNNPASKKEGKKIVDFKGLFFPKLFQCPEREANMASKSTHSPMQMLTTCPSMRAATTMRRRKLVVLPQTIFLCDTTSRRRCQEEKNYSTLWCDTWADKEDI